MAMQTTSTCLGNLTAVCLFLALLQYWSEEMAEIARIRACQCHYRPNGRTPTRLGPGRLWAR